MENGIYGKGYLGHTEKNVVYIISRVKGRI
jgi:hypothetical protein